MSLLERIEEVLDEPGCAAAIAAVEAKLPIGVRPRQLRLRTLLVGMCLALGTGAKKAHLVAVHLVLSGLDQADQLRLGVSVRWRSGEHLLTYRQLSYTFALLAAVLDNKGLDGTASSCAQQLHDALLEGSVPSRYKNASSSYAIDWTDLESFSRPPLREGDPCCDPQAGWGHRRGDGPGQRDELFFGYFCSLMTMVKDEGGPELPELVRRMSLSSCSVDPVAAFVPVVTASASAGVVVLDLLADCGYSHRVASSFAYPLRAAGARLVIDLHPQDRGTKGTYAGATLFNGNLYCPSTPKALFEIGPLARDAGKEAIAAHDTRSAELARYKLGRLSSDDADGYHRVACPAVAGSCRCPLRPASMALSQDRPQVLTPPPAELAPVCCVQQSVTVPPSVNPKTAQKHDYPSAKHRRSYARRSAVERSNSMLKSASGIDIDLKGWCQLMGLSPISLFLACACVVVNFELIDAFEARQAETARRAASGIPIVRRTRRRRRRTLAELAAGRPPPP
jgi:hypothetical protein